MVVEAIGPEIDGRGQPGIRTFLIADVRGYTRFTVEHGDAAAARLAQTFAALANGAVGAHAGTVIELRGDEALAVFASARGALRAATDLQDRVAEQSRVQPDLAMRIGIGLDAGEAIPVDGGFRGAALNLAARLCSLAGPGEVLASDTVVSLARKLDGIEYLERGMVPLKGFSDPVRVMQVTTESRLDEKTSPERPLPIGGFLGALPAGPLVARGSELERVLAPLETVAGGTGRLVMLAGEPGAGKTRLAQEVTLAARNRGFVVAAGSCYEARQSVPYYPFLDALGSLYDGAPAALRSSVAMQWPQLARLLPEAAIGAASMASDGQQEQERLFRAVAGFIGALSETAPVALFLDDLHWADGSSLEMLRHLAKHTRGERVLILATYRDVEVGRRHPLENTLLDLTREGLVERVPVRRLDHDGTAALISATFGEQEVSHDFADLVFQHTEGNPFFTQEVLRAMVERGDLFQQGGIWDRRPVADIEVPESVRAVIGRRLSRLEQESQDVLCEASVLGTRFNFDDLQAMSDASEQSIERALEEGTAAGLIRDMGRDRYAFNHALTQQSLYAEMPSRRRRRLHLAAAESIESLPQRKRMDRTGELAWHFLEGDDPERALRYSLAAGDEATVLFAWPEAKEHFKTALELAQEMDDRPHVAEASHKLGRAFHTTADFDAALPHLERAAAACEALGDALAEARALQLAGFVYMQRNLTDQVSAARTHIQILRERIADLEPSIELVEFYRTESVVLWAQGQLTESMTVINRAMDAAAAVGNEPLRVRTALQRAVSLGQLGHIQDALDAAISSVPHAERTGDTELLLEASSSAAEWLMLAGRLEESLTYWERDLQTALAMGWVFHSDFALCNLAQIQFYLGNWDRAQTFAEQGLSRGEEHGMGFVARTARMNLGTIALGRGDWDEARRLLLHAAQDPAGSLQIGRYAERALAEVELREGMPEQAANRLRHIVDSADRDDVDIMLVLPVLAHALVETGDAAAGEQLARQVLEEAAENALACVDAWPALGLALSRQGHHPEAGQAFQEGVSLARRMPYPYAEATTLAMWGIEDGSRERLEEALTIFRRLGAQKDIEKIEQKLAS